MNPLVTVLMPVRDEGEHIERSLGSVLAQSYGLERMEILVVDGRSIDDTRERVRSLAAEHPEADVRILDNPGRTAPLALNIGLRAARGEVIVRVDGHCEIGPDYVENGVCHLFDSDDPVDGVGGPLETIGETPTARAIAAAMSSRFGVGGSAFRVAGIDGRRVEDRLVDTIAFPAYRRDVFGRVGLFDEELTRNQDDEFNYRLRKAGGKLRLTADMPARYYSRGTFAKLWRQYFQYGVFKVRVLQKHPRQTSVRHFVPGVFVLTLGVGVFVVPRLGPKLLLAVLVSYTAANLAATASNVRRAGPGGAWRLPIAFAILHLGYGAGFLAGLVRFARRWRSDREPKA